jgi:hypothetical protein
MTGILHFQSPDIKTYQVKKITEELVVTGKGDSHLWKKGNTLTNFNYPWEKEKAPQTVFKALHSNDWLYCLFEVSDNNVNIYKDTNEKSEVVFSDRVEIFFKKDDDLNPYYCLELDPLARVFDYEAKYHRQFNSEWSWPAGELVVKSSRKKEGYIVEIAISKRSLNQLGMLKDKNLQAGLFRGNCISLSGKEATIKWISWVKPKSPDPDFHIPSAFGVLTLED